MSEKSINWSKMVCIWKCYENMGISPKKFSDFVESISSPVLIAGAGAGINSEYLIEKGYDVTSIDTCQAMIDLAMKDRGIEVIHSDGGETPFENTAFSTVILSTGIFNAYTLYNDNTDRLLMEAKRLLKDGGKVLIAFFRNDERLEYLFHQLGLDRTPSNNALFAGAETIEEVKTRFLEQTVILPSIIHHLFHEYPQLIADHHALIRCIERELTTKGMEAVPYIRDNIGFPYNDIKPDDLKYLHSRIGHFFEIEKQMTLSDNETELIIAS